MDFFDIIGLIWWQLKTMKACDWGPVNEGEPDPPFAAMAWMD